MFIITHQEIRIAICFLIAQIQLKATSRLDVQLNVKGLNVFQATHTHTH